MWLGIVAIVIVLIAVACYLNAITIAFTSCSQFEDYSRNPNEKKTRMLFKKGCDCKRIVIGDGRFRKVRVVELDGLSELESVVIGTWSFTYAKEDDDIRNSERNDGSYRIVNCPKLKSIQIGRESFRDYHTFELNNLPSLQSIDIGMYCFEYAPFSLIGMIGGMV